MNAPDGLQLQWQSREANKQARQAEMQRRTREHQLKVARYKRHRETKALAAGPEPLNLHAIGDSWFEYPLNGNILIPFSNFGIVADSQLGAKGTPNPNIFSRAEHGQASTAVLSWQNQSEMVNDWIDPSNWLNGKLDAILVSMGGDDIVGDQLAIYLTYGGAVQSASARLQGVLDLVSSSYSDLFALRDLFAPGVPIFGHCYDYALPNGVPAAAVFGPWLQPSFKFAYYNFADAKQVVKDMIDKFYSMLNALAADPRKNFHLIDTRSTIAPNNASPDGWANELHPYPTGFGHLADRFLTALHAHFPGRI
jgi:hypothetical protein